MVDLVGQIQSPHGHAEQKPEPGHGPVAPANAHGALGQVQLEAAHVLGRGALRRVIEKGGEQQAKPVCAIEQRRLDYRFLFPPAMAAHQHGGGVS